MAPILPHCRALCRLPRAIRYRFLVCIRADDRSVRPHRHAGLSVLFPLFRPPAPNGPVLLRVSPQRLTVSRRKPARFTALPRAAPVGVKRFCPAFVCVRSPAALIAYAQRQQAYPLSQVVLSRPAHAPAAIAGLLVHAFAASLLN